MVKCANNDRVGCFNPSEAVDAQAYVSNNALASLTRLQLNKRDLNLADKDQSISLIQGVKTCAIKGVLMIFSLGNRSSGFFYACVFVSQNWKFLKMYHFIITFYEDDYVLQQVVCLSLKLKGLVNPNMKILSSFINLHVIPNLVRSVGSATI